MTTSPNDDAAIRWDNPIFAGPGSHDRPVDITLGTNFVGSPSANVIGITGRSYAGPATKYDIVTVLIEAGTGNLWSVWGNVGWGKGARSFDGTAHSNDRPVGLDLHWTNLLHDESGGDLFVVVAGTTRSVNNSQTNDDIWTIEYEPNGDVRWEQVYNGPANGDDVATAMTLFGGVFVCGYTPHYVGGDMAATSDTDYIALAYYD
ncbi:MAG: hypothetical protein IID31_14605, partial [Planctomycetes bacterium]|nr:hypothetical protein [Planctomycetota bacterium]